MIAALVGDSFAFVKPAIRQGEFATALRLLTERQNSPKANRIEEDILFAELYLETGRISEAVEKAASVLRQDKADLAFVARSRWVLAVAEFYSGNATGCVEMLSLAETASELANSDALKAHVQVLGLGLALTTHPIDVALTRLPAVKRAVGQRAADASLMVCLELLLPEQRRVGRRHWKLSGTITTLCPSSSGSPTPGSKASSTRIWLR